MSLILIAYILTIVTLPIVRIYTSSFQRNVYPRPMRILMIFKNLLSSFLLDLIITVVTTVLIMLLA